MVFESFFTYQISQQLRYRENLYCNNEFVRYVSSVFGDYVINDNLRLCHNRYNKSSRIKKRLIKLLVKRDINSLDGYFCTFTINDNFINLPYLTLRKYFTDFLKSNFSSYVGNADYGTINGRLHFHAVVLCNRSPPLWRYGFYDYRPLFNSIDDIGSCSNYLNKLTNHSTKIKSRIICSEDLR